MKTQAKLLSDLDRDLIKTVAGQVMGWIVLEKYKESSDDNVTYYFLDEGRPIKGTTWPYSECLRQLGVSPYGIQWELWNPLTDPAACNDVVRELIRNGFKIEFTISAESTLCTISNAPHSILTADSEVYAKDNEYTLGQALCEAAIDMYKRIGGGSPSINDWIKRPQSGDKIEVYTRFTKEWIPCTYREGGMTSFLRFEGGLLVLLDENTQDGYPKWRYAITA